MEQYKWQYRFLELANLISTWSKDESTKVGCVITTSDRRIISTGYNGLPRHSEDNSELYPKRHDRKENKYDWYCHAEENAITNAAFMGASLEGSSAYVTMEPCPKCARMLAQSGVKEVWFDETKTALYHKSRGLINLRPSKEILASAGVASYGLQIYPHVALPNTEEPSQD